MSKNVQNDLKVLNLNKAQIITIFKYIYTESNVIGCLIWYFNLIYIKLSRVNDINMDFASFTRLISK